MRQLLIFGRVIVAVHFGRLFHLFEAIIWTCLCQLWRHDLHCDHLFFTHGVWYALVVLRLLEYAFCCEVLKILFHHLLDNRACVVRLCLDLLLLVCFKLALVGSLEELFFLFEFDETAAIIFERFICLRVFIRVLRFTVWLISGVED